MQGLSGQRTATLEKWEFEVEVIPGAGWDISGDSCSFTDEDRRQWRLRLPIYLVADHLTAEPEFLAMVARVRVSDEQDAAWIEAACFSPRSGEKGRRRALMTRILEVAAEATPGLEERALQALIPPAWTVPGTQPDRRAAYASQNRYLARLWIGAQVLACRVNGCCVECRIAMVDAPAHKGDYCKDHLLHADHEQFDDVERARRRTLRQSKVRHRKAVEHLFLELARADSFGPLSRSVSRRGPETRKPCR